jgi:hypothetical protein
MMTKQLQSNLEETLPFGPERTALSVSRSHAFGLVIHGVAGQSGGDYLHEVLLAKNCREAFWELIEREGLVICKNVPTDHPGYRKVRGKSSKVKLSQAEYYHHDGCSCPTKPRVVEIRLPYQDIERTVATAVAPFADVMLAMLQTLPTSLVTDELKISLERFSGTRNEWPPAESWDSIQGRVTRIVRKEMDAESCRAYFRDVDQQANAYVMPWEMGESRLMLNNTGSLSTTMQHRRAYQPADQTAAQNGSLVKRWPAEELD